MKISTQFRITPKRIGKSCPQIFLAGIECKLKYIGSLCKISQRSLIILRKISKMRSLQKDGIKYPQIMKGAVFSGRLQDYCQPKQ